MILLMASKQFVLSVSGFETQQNFSTYKLSEILKNSTASFFQVWKFGQISKSRK